MRRTTAFAFLKSIAPRAASVCLVLALSAKAQSPQQKDRPAKAKQPVRQKRPAPSGGFKDLIERRTRPTVVLKPGEIPKIDFDARIHDFGRVRSGIEVVHDFWFANTGNGTLEILEVKPGCACTRAGQHPRIIRPGERARIPVRMFTDDINGTLRKVVAVMTNVPGDDAVVKLQFQGEIWKPLEFRPPRASFGRLSVESLEDARPEIKVRIINQLDRPVSLTNVRSTLPIFRPSIEPIEPGKSFELRVKLGKPSRTGAIGGLIRIDTGHQDAPTVDLPVSVYVMDFVEVLPRQLRVRPLRNRPLRLQVLIVNGSQRKLSVGGLQASNPLIKMTLEEIEPGARFKIRVELPVDYVVPPNGDTIAIETNHPRAPRLIVPILPRSPETDRLVTPRAPRD